MGMTFEEMQRTDIFPFGIGSGWILARNHGPSPRDVLCGRGRHWQRVAPLASRDASGRLAVDAALPVLEHISTLWNQRAAKLRGEAPPAPPTPVQPNPVYRADDPGPHEYTIRSPFQCGDEVLSDEHYKGMRGLVLAVEFVITPPSTVTRKVHVKFENGITLGLYVEKLRLAPPKVDTIAKRVAELRVGDRVTPNFGVQEGRVCGTLVGLYLPGGPGGRVVAKVRWDSGDSQRDIDPKFLRPAL